MKAALPALASFLALAACVQSVAPPAPLPPFVIRPAQTPSPPPAPVVQQPAYANWMDAPQTAGNWRYIAYTSTTRAEFSAPDERLSVFTIQCDNNVREILLVRTGTGRSMRMRTETAERSLATHRGHGETDFSVAALSANDPLLDAMALSKGRFAVEVEGEATLILPSHAEVSRVIEDCR